MWRPKEGWENYYTFMDGKAIPGYERQARAFEEGADEILACIVKHFAQVRNGGNKITTLNKFLRDIQNNS